MIAEAEPHPHRPLLAGAVAIIEDHRVIIPLHSVPPAEPDVVDAVTADIFPGREAHPHIALGDRGDLLQQALGPGRSAGQDQEHTGGDCESESCHCALLDP